VEKRVWCGPVRGRVQCEVMVFREQMTEVSLRQFPRAKTELHISRQHSLTLTVLLAISVNDFHQLTPPHDGSEGLWLLSNTSPPLGVDDPS
jgi:hypothetical protein